MDEDEDVPPMLVSADGNSDPTEARLSAQIDDMKIAKVPITIITGQSISSRLCEHNILCCVEFDTASDILAEKRLSRVDLVSLSASQSHPSISTL